MESQHSSFKVNRRRVSVRKDLFGAQHSEPCHILDNKSTEDTQSPLKSIWGEGDGFNFTQPNSLLLSPALKRSPKKFSNTPSPKKSPSTPKKSVSTPRKLSKYSPFRKRVYNPNPRNSIKNFFPIREQGPSQEEHVQKNSASIGIERLVNAGASTSSSMSLVSSENSQTYNGKTKQPQDGHSEMTPKKMFVNETNMYSTPIISPIKSNSSIPQSASKKLSPMPNITGSKDIYASFLLRILLNTVVKDSFSDSEEKIFSDEEYEHINAFNKFDQPSQRLYARLLNRKHDWIRTATMKYGDVNLELLFLEQQGFITSDCSFENLGTLLNLLTLPELKQLCKSYKLPETGIKADLISRLILISKQPSIKSFFTQCSSSNSSESNLRAKISQLLGSVIKVSSGPQRTISRCLLYFSYPHYRGLEKDRFSDQLALVSKLRDLTFPSYEINCTRIFPSRQHFLMYETALLESSELIETKEGDSWELFLHKLRDIIKKLERYLADNNIRTEIEAMPDFLRKFTPGACYLRTVSSLIDFIKKRDHCLAEACLKLLLNQRFFSRHHRGKWFDQLARIYQRNVKDNIKATEIVLRGLRDEYTDEVSKHTLYARAVMLEGRKKDGLKDYLKDALAKQRGSIVALEEPPSVTISEKVLHSSRPGLKKVYVVDSEEGTMLSSVEEVAREHFRRQGYTHGVHDEGGIVKSLVFACFWDELYGISTVDGHGVFHSEYQTVPLDWNSETFYDRRKEYFKSKLQDLAEGGVEALIHTFQQSYVNHLNTESIVNWKYLDNYEITEGLIRCIGIDLFLNLSRLFLRHHRTYGSGFPDLTLWDPKDNKCVFVEVKSPNDVLSMNQKVWINNLNKMGGNAVVCHVHSVGCKGQKRKASPTKENE